jgi:hypothetical protein
VCLELLRMKSMGRGAFGEGCDMSVAGLISGHGVDSTMYDQRRLDTV